MNYFVAILAIGLLIALHELGHYLVARLTGMKVMTYSVGFGPAIFKWTSKKTDIKYQIGAIPLGGFVQIKGQNPFEDGAFEDSDSFQTQSILRRAAVILAGPLANFFIAWAVLFAVYTSGVPEEVDESRLGRVVADAPADEAGLREGDSVLEFDSEKSTTWSQLRSNLHANPEKEVSLLIERDGEQMTVKVTPERHGDIGLIGVYPPTEDVSLPIGDAAGAALMKTVGTIAMTFSTLASLVSGEADDVSAVGPVGIVKMAASSLDSGLNHFFALVSYLSVMLFLFNLFPLPALDGGRTIFLLYEAVTRRRVNKKVDAAVNTVGFLVLMGIILIITFKEIFFG